MISLNKFAAAWGAAALTVFGIGLLADMRAKAKATSQSNNNGSVY